MNAIQTGLPRRQIDDRITLGEAATIAMGKVALLLSPKAEGRVARSHQRLVCAISENRHIYGLTTGFGPLVNRLVRPADGARLQQNLVHHLASGVGPVFAWAEGRAIVLARLMSILQGVSGASPQSVRALLAVLNSDLSPELPTQGTVGASGDLTPLSHMVLCLQGRGRFRMRDGAVCQGAAGLARMNLPPLDLGQRDALALVNGTSAMTGLAVLSAADCARRIAWSLALTAALLDVMRGRLEAWDPEFHRVRPHPGQARAAEILVRRLDGSTRVRRVPISDRRLRDDDYAASDIEAGQDAYTLRCAPQVIGAVADVLDWHDIVAERELNAATDNPIFPPEGNVIALHGGNFMGQHVGLASDALLNAIVVLAGLTERQMARLTDERLSGLGPFLAGGPPGLTSGFMGAQVTSTAILAELRSNAGAASIQSLSTNGANQDVVSMGTIAARKVRMALTALGDVQAILALAIAQAIDQTGRAGGGHLAPCTRRLRDAIRGVSDEVVEDRPLSDDIAVVRALMDGQDPPRV